MTRSERSTSSIVWEDCQLFDPTEAESTEEAVFIGQQATGETVVIGQENNGEWIKTSDIEPVSVDKCK